MKLSIPQSEVANSKTRFRVLACGRRWGKTTLAIRELAYHAREPESVCWYVTGSYRAAKGLAWEPLKTQLGRLNWIKKVNEAELTITLKNGSRICLRGSENPDALRGFYIKGILILDEAQDVDPKTWDVLRPTLSDHKARVLICGTPKGRSNQLFDFFQKGQDTTETEWQSWQYTTAQGGWVDEEELRQAQKDLDPRTYKVEYEAEFANYEGVVYYAFDRAKHIRDITFDQPQQVIHLGLDFNINPISAVAFIYKDNHFHIIDEIEMYGSNTDEMCQEILAKFPNAKVFAYPDPSAKAKKTSAGGRTDVSILQNNGFIVKMFNKHMAIRDRVNAVNTQLMNGAGQSNITIHPRCKKLIQCLERQIYKPGTSQPEKDTGYDHMNDALGYAVSFLKPIRREYEEQQQPQTWGVKVA
jgi:phage terminase large subunit